MPDASEADVLRELIRASGLSQPQLARKVGIAQSTISAVLSGARSLTKEQVIACEVFSRVASGFLAELAALLRCRVAISAAAFG